MRTIVCRPCVVWSWLGLVWLGLYCLVLSCLVLSSLMVTQASRCPPRPRFTFRDLASRYLVTCRSPLLPLSFSRVVFISFFPRLFVAPAATDRICLHHACSGLAGMGARPYPACQPYICLSIRLSVFRAAYAVRS